MAKYISAFVEFPSGRVDVTAKVSSVATEEEIEEKVLEWIWEKVYWGYADSITLNNGTAIEDWTK